jgi:hypothetical protein
MSNRTAAERELLHFIDRFAPGSPNRGIYEQRLAAMSDAEFDAFMTNLESGTETLALFIANLTEHKLSLQRNLKIAEELDYNLFQHLYLTDPHTGQVTKTVAKHLVVLLPLRRQAQMLWKKMSIPESNSVVDERSGQATGSSKGSRLSYPELQVNAAKGLDQMVLELIKFRGGDEKAYLAMNRQLLETGEASLEAAAQMPSKVKATQSLSVMLTGMHLKNNL